MAVQVGKAPFTLVWDDGFMLIFWFPDPVNSSNPPVNCGFPHQVVSVANQAGNQVTEFKKVLLDHLCHYEIVLHNEDRFPVLSTHHISAGLRQYKELPGSPVLLPEPH